MSTGGPLQELSIKGRIFSVASDSDIKTDIGGYKNKLEMNGNGTARTIKERKGWLLGGPKVDISDARGDAEFLQDIADSGETVPITGTYADGTTRMGTGTLLEDIVVDAKSATAELTLGGGGKFEAQ